MKYDGKPKYAEMKLNLKYAVIIAGLVIVVLVFMVVFSEAFGADPNPTGNPVGGGAGYNKIISENDSSVKYVITTKDQLLNALKSAKSGDTIFVKGNANIDMTGTYGTSIPAGITLASDRGINGSQGGRIFQNRILSDPKPPNWDTSNGSMLIAVGNNVRITGLRLEGPDKTTTAMDDKGVKYGIFLRQYGGLEVDNCEIWGWSSAGIYIYVMNTTLLAEGLASPEIGANIANIHHNYIHHCQSDGLGYGVVIGSGSALIKANIFDFTRHAIADSGLEMNGYEASYNKHLGNSTNAVFDVHGYAYLGTTIAGNFYNIHHNTVMARIYAVGIRGVPIHQANIKFNSFMNCSDIVRCNYYDVGGQFPVYQADGRGNITMTQNLIESVYSPEGPIYYFTLK
jgi:hypothetical protein